MNALHPNNIYELYNIPIYQRLFTWGKEQIETLLDDLLYEFLSTNRDGDYYLGVLTLTENANGRKDLVDGQQRFTILVLIGIALLNEQDVKTEWLNFLQSEDNLRLDFSARPDDRNFIINLITAAKEKRLDDLLKSDSKDEYVNDTMKRALLMIKEYMRNINIIAENVYPTENKDRHVSVCDFSQYIYNHLTFFSTELPKDYSARMLNTHFERMNSTGRNLENHEILKVSLLKEIHNEGGDAKYNYYVQIWNKASRMTDLIRPFYDEKTRKEYLETIKQVHNDLSSAYGIVTEDKEKQIDKSRQLTDDNSIMAVIDGKTELISIKKNDESSTSNYRSFMTFTDFLLQVLYLLLDNDKRKGIVIQHFFNPNKLIETCEKYIGNDKAITPEDYITAVGKYRIIFDYYILRIDGNGSYRLASAGDLEHDKLEQYEAMLYADSSRYTYYRWIPFILEYVSNEENILDNEQILSKLKVHDSSIDEHQKAEFDNFSFGKFNNYYFRRLDYYLWEFFISNKHQNQENLNALLPKDVGALLAKDDVTIKAIKDYKFHQYNSVEHFHPQNEDEQSIKWKEQQEIDAFGNLALISDSFNSTQSNNALEMKFARVEEQISKEDKLESIKLALMYYSANKKASNWTIQTMHDHQKFMVNFLKGTYNTKK